MRLWCPDYQQPRLSSPQAQIDIAPPKHLHAAALTEQVLAHHQTIIGHRLTATYLCQTKDRLSCGLGHSQQCALDLTGNQQRVTGMGYLLVATMQQATHHTHLWP
ncbi:hypothetical protein D3C79_981420 [compost metagenome]